MIGIMKTYENNSMSLSCCGEMKIKDGIIVELSFKGYPRTNGDGWTSFYERHKLGDTVTYAQIKNMKKFNGKYNVISKFLIL